MSASKPQESGEVRLGHSLNKKEEEFVARRKITVLQCLQKFNIHCSQDRVPNIALLGSGGGQRAMVALLECLVQIDKAGLLDCILYLSGVSGSTWCMASLYKEPNWSTKLETVKENIIKRLGGPGVSWDDKSAKLKKYYMKDFFSLTDLWAVLFVTSYVKEIDEQTFTDQRDQHNEDPYPIYAVIDKQCKRREEGDPWFEISPHEAGYSLTGAFVDTCDFGSQFDNGLKKKHQNEMDMLYLQGKKHCCRTAVTCRKRNVIKDDWKCSKIIFQLKTLFCIDIAFIYIAQINTAGRIWGRNYNFLHNMTDESVPAALLQKETRDLIDAGLLINSPYLSMLRKERNIDLFIALDFSDGDPFTTVREAAKTCKKLNIPFPEVNVPSDEGKKPKDFYVFKGQNVPTVIHMPLFNVVNCGDKPGDWRKKYGILKGPYSAEMITEVMGVAGKNISNNIEKLLEEIRAVAEAK
uniref:PLA2c domain-containing protein n=1 Tax=Cyprinus carpio TaxID=7962 RepID=A0A8C2C361_CYPCA